MKIILDGEEINVPSEVVSEGKRALFEEARRTAGKKGRVITGIKVDGVDIEDADAFAKLSGGQDIRFTTQLVRELVSESIDEGKKYMPKLFAGLETIATKYEAGEQEEARAMFSAAVDGVNWTFGVFEKCCGLLGIVAKNFRSGDFDTDAESLKQALSEMNAAIEKGQDLKLAYTIRESLLPTLRRFAGYWDEVASTLETPLQ